MTSVVTFKTGFLSHCVRVLKALEQNNIGWLHELELLRRLGMPTDRAKSPVALIDVHTLRVN